MGRFTLLPAVLVERQIHVAFVGADKEDPWEYAWVEFDGIRVKEFLETAGLTTQGYAG